MRYAIEKKLPVDAFIMFTDNETGSGWSKFREHPCKALKDYRKEMGINAKLIVVAMALNSFTIADPKDLGMLDIAGFDSTAPQIISQFITM
jgi:60 kDa SS-A/Ro ribonucleoprotein